MNPEYITIAISAIEQLAEAAPSIVSDIKSLLAPIKEGRAPTAEEWQVAQAGLETANKKVQTG
ncbi:hypothetical protein [Acetobacter persici]|uniref:Uncharacterized protein n=1 Tax=Acetobacter persici TaxID=1076596 RepID=A0A1U9LER9_9PROT|nr:hypothetical protein [Acetobacter persici]AQT04858.1 hypothetical protein A0U91_07910 [Acetobacter persici]